MTRMPASKKRASYSLNYDGPASFHQHQLLCLGETSCLKSVEIDSTCYFTCIEPDSIFAGTLLLIYERLNLSSEYVVDF